MVGLVDFNTPNARQQSRLEGLTQAISIVNDSGVMQQNCSLILLPDHAKDSSLRGLYDEEKSIIESLFSFKQHVETRFVDLFTRDRRSENKTMIRFSAGRIVVNGETSGDNCWLESELAVCGRPVGRAEGDQGAPTSVLPRTSALLLPEAPSTESDLKLAERTRPSPEQQAAQKGVQRIQLLLDSLFRHVTFKGPCIIVNFTGYVEEVGAAESQPD